MYSKEHKLEKQREAQKRYRARHAEELKDKAESVKGTPEQRALWREKTRKWRAANPEASKRTQVKSDKKRYYGSKAEAFALLGDKCARCEYSNPEVLQVDHIIAIGDAKRQEFHQRGHVLYYDVIAHPEKYQLLCPTHNWEKRVENKEGNKGGNHRRAKVIVETENSALVI